jgi:predicted PurR-regulated permease PerM
MKKYGQWRPPVRYAVLALASIAFAAALWFVRGILEPLIIAAFVAYIINPAVNFLIGHTRMSRKGSVNLVYFVALAIFIGTPATLTPLFFDELKQVVTDILDLFNQAIVWLQGPRILPGLPVDFGQWADRLIQFRATFLTSLPDQALQLLEKTSVGALRFVVILVAIYYFLAEWPRLREGFIASFPKKYGPELGELYQRVRRIWMGYLRGQLLLMAIVTVVFTIAWTLIGIPGALVLGVVAGFLTLIPDIGPFLAAALAVAVALLEGSNWWPALPHWSVAAITIAAYLVLISIKNFWVRPVVMGRSVHMNEAIVLISILLATVLWGILGALLVVPVLASLAVIVDYLRRRILGMEPFPEAEPFVSEIPLSSRDKKIAAIRSRIAKKRKG